jgi:hypothetical protein
VQPAATFLYPFGSGWRIKIPEPSQGIFRLFSGEVTGLGVNLPDWRYPAVFHTEMGQAHYDIFGGRWGEEGNSTSSSKPIPRKK